MQSRKKEFFSEENLRSKGRVQKRGRGMNIKKKDHFDSEDDAIEDSNPSDEEVTFEHNIKAYCLN